MSMRGVYIMKNSPFYWLRYYDKLESDPKKRRKSVNTKIEVTEQDRLRHKTGKKLVGTPALRRLVESFRLALAERVIENKIEYKLIKYKYLEDVLNEYLYEHPHLAESSAYLYKLVIKKFIKILGNKPINKYTNKDYYEFIQTLKNNNANPTTISTLSKHLIPIFNYAKKKLYVKESIIKQIPAPKGIPSPIPLNDLNVILNYYKRKENKEHYYIVLLLLLTGLRPSSLQKMKFSDIDFENKYITIYNIKGKKIFPFPLTNRLKQILLEKKREQNLKDDDYVINLRTKMKFWHRDIIKLYKEGKIKKKYQLYQLRDTFSSILARNKVDVSVVQELLNHSNPNITKEHYMLIENEMKLKLLEQAFEGLN